ncbi:uncharacterized protein [Elaeis guineensis]|uniref:Uncharacterized protein LOC105041837 n=1 Tax=Elaeis guineensis var. tenera TaxID=51953 RepID=A0A6I9QY14_ELAGV|nr:uncharacterized protein LOC105041837 [Elaeis guineensis]XP_010917197.1 uncharacterized protein LOC105041837 [Elaeis guineensis]XP_010917204.1 uncharacterized protein LOC105041837 [Elaeis guineensis]XP_029119939.1 uncharacterized protein LOC105041837 [Elaeis guineensis]
MNNSIPANLSSLHAFVSWSKVQSGAEYSTDVTLRLDSPGTSSLYSFNAKGTKRKWGDISGLEGPEHPLLALGLGQSPSSSDISKVSSTTACTMSSVKETDEESSADLGLNFQLHLGNENMPSPKKSSVAAPQASGSEPIYDFQPGLSTGPSESVITGISPVSDQLQNSLDTSAVIGQVPTVDEGSASSRGIFGSYVAPSLYISETTSSFPSNQNIHAKADPVAVVPDLTSTRIQTVKSPVACTSGVTHLQQRNITTKTCQFQGCGKGARGVSGLCIAHGGGRRCQRPGCHKGAEGRTIFCKAHGGGWRCQHLGSTKSADEGCTDYCIAHGSTTACTMSSVKETDEESSADLGLNFQLHLGDENMPSPKKSSVAAQASGSELIYDLQLGLSTGPSESVITGISPVSDQLQNSLDTSAVIGQVPKVDEGLASSRWIFGSYVAPSLYISETTSSFPSNQKIHAKADPVAVVPDLTSTKIQTLKSPVACTSGVTHLQQRSITTKTCQFQGCGKGARGASGLCIAHGGGRRCQRPGCHKGAEGRTIFCKAHGGGRRCQHLGCTKSAEGRTDYCIAHGGGRRCSHEGCIRAARGKSGLCIRHGGGKRCQRENCTKSAEGYSGLCISHGGGRRCQFPGCSKGAQGSTMFCKAHGGGKRCTFLGCTKGAEGSTPFCKGHGGGKRCSFQGGGVCPKSVHGGTQFCVAHGGGKRCAVPGCTKSARGRTDFCVRHGGGKRCKFEGCGKSAQGSTDFCKAHGGGKRCSWGQVGSNLGAGAPPCDRFARGKTGLCAAHSALVQDRCVHGGGSLGLSATQYPTLVKTEKMKDIIVEEDTFSKIGNDGEKFAGWSDCDTKNNIMPHLLPCQPGSVSLPEGRVHGGSLLVMLASSAGLPSNSTSQSDAGTSEKNVSHPMMRRWI